MSKRHWNQREKEVRQETLAQIKEEIEKIRGLLIDEKSHEDARYNDGILSMKAKVLALLDEVGK